MFESEFFRSNCCFRPLWHEFARAQCPLSAYLRLNFKQKGDEREKKRGSKQRKRRKKNRNKRGEKEKWKRVDRIPVAVARRIFEGAFLTLFRSAVAGAFNGPGIG